MVLKNWNLENLGLIAILFPEIIFNQPDFNSSEKSFQFLSSVYNKTKKKQDIIIQTRKPESVLFKIIRSDNPNKFYSEELKNRKAFSKTQIGYPPFAKLIKLIYKDFIHKECENEAKKLYQLLQNRVTNDKNLKNKFEVIKPFPALNYKESGKYRWHLIIKSTCQNIELRNLFLNSVPKNWIVDIDPVSIC